jgi:hypothetical protein
MFVYYIITHNIHIYIDIEHQISTKEHGYEKKESHKRKCFAVTMGRWKLDFFSISL